MKRSIGLAPDCQAYLLTTELSPGGATPCLVKPHGAPGALHHVMVREMAPENCLRIMPSGIFFRAVRKYRLKVKGIHVDRIAARVAKIVALDPAEVWVAGKQRNVVQARSLLHYGATN